MQKLIHFRDLGCQAAKEIIESAISYSKNEKEIKKSSPKHVLFFTKNEEKAKNQVELWQEVCNALSMDFSCISESSQIIPQAILIVENSLLSEVENSDIQNPIIAQSLNEDYLSSNALAMFTNFTYAALCTNKPIYKLQIAWMGDCNGMYKDYTSSLLNATICLQNELSLSFAENLDCENCLPEKSVLDFAMYAGSKIFLTYDPAFVPTECDVLFLSNWTYKEQASFAQLSHPFTFSTVRDNFSENTQLISFIKEIPSSEIILDLYKKAVIFTRIATLNYIVDLH